MHVSQIYTDGPATSRDTSFAFLPQNEQLSPARGRSRRAMPASLMLAISFIHDSCRQNSRAYPNL
jgi:hypothetical protein